MYELYQSFLRHELANCLWIIGLAQDTYSKKADPQYLESIATKVKIGNELINQWHRLDSRKYLDQEIDFSFTIMIYAVLNSFEMQGYKFEFSPMPLTNIALHKNEKQLVEALEFVLKEILKQKEREKLSVNIIKDNSAVKIIFKDCHQELATKETREAPTTEGLLIRSKDKDLEFVINL